MFPVVLLAYDRLILQPSDAAARRRLLRVCVPMVAFVALAAGARLLVFAGVENVSRASFAVGNLPVGIDVVRRYFRLMFLVEPQSVFHTALVPSSFLRPLVILNVLWFLVVGTIDLAGLQAGARHRVRRALVRTHALAVGGDARGRYRRADG